MTASAEAIDWLLLPGLFLGFPPFPVGYSSQLGDKRAYILADWHNLVSPDVAHSWAYAITIAQADKCFES